MADELIAFDKSELRMVFKALKNMGEEANEEAKRQSGALAEFARAEVIQTAGRGNNTKVSGRIAQGSKVKKSSRIGEITYGFASQKFSGGATTKTLWGGMEFGSNRFKQFPNRTPRYRKGNVGYFIYPTLKAAQPHIINEWQIAFDKILKEF